MNVFKPPVLSNVSEHHRIRIFLGGSIEMGKAVEWQSRVTTFFSDREVTFFNPRRDDYDPSWRQSIDEPNFVGQVIWEMDHLDRCDLAVFFIQGNTMSPITLGEIYYMAARDPSRMIVAVESDFWRRGNIEVMAYRHGFPLLSSLDELENKLMDILNEHRVEVQVSRKHIHR